jgi:hypothetical protein
VNSRNISSGVQGRQHTAILDGFAHELPLCEWHVTSTMKYSYERYESHQQEHVCTIDYGAATGRVHAPVPRKCMNFTAAEMRLKQLNNDVHTNFLFKR